MSNTRKLLSRIAAAYLIIIALPTNTQNRHMHEWLWEAHERVLFRHG